MGYDEVPLFYWDTIVYTKSNESTGVSSFLFTNKSRVRFLASLGINYVGLEDEGFLLAVLPGNKTRLLKVCSGGHPFKTMLT